MDKVKAADVEEFLAAMEASHTNYSRTVIADHHHDFGSNITMADRTFYSRHITFSAISCALYK